MNDPQNGPVDGARGRAPDAADGRQALVDLLDLASSEAWPESARWAVDDPEALADELLRQVGPLPEGFDLAASVGACRVYALSQRTQHSRGHRGSGRGAWPPLQAPLRVRDWLRRDVEKHRQQQAAAPPALQVVTGGRPPSDRRRRVDDALARLAAELGDDEDANHPTRGTA